MRRTILENDNIKSMTKKITAPYVSVVMPVYNSELYLKESISSVLSQSLSNFEFIIVDDGSTDNSVEIIKSFSDSRITLIQNNHNFIDSLNKGIFFSNADYIARMDSDDIMHPDRLKVQYNIMKESPDITVCGSFMFPFKENKMLGSPMSFYEGVILYPLVYFMKGNFMFHPTTMIRKKFLISHNLSYQNYSFAEDFKLWTEIAKCGGVFYVESQPLLYYRLSDEQVTSKNIKQQSETSYKIRKEVIDYLIRKNEDKYPELLKLYACLEEMRNSNLTTFDKNVKILQDFFLLNKKILHLD